MVNISMKISRLCPTTGKIRTFFSNELQVHVIVKRSSNLVGFKTRIIFYGCPGYLASFIIIQYCKAI